MEAAKAQLSSLASEQLGPRLSQMEQQHRAERTQLVNAALRSLTHLRTYLTETLTGLRVVQPALHTRDGHSFGVSKPKDRWGLPSKARWGVLNEDGEFEAMTVRLEPGPSPLGVQSLGGGALSPRLNPLHLSSKLSGVKSSTVLLGSRSSPALPRYPPPRRLHPPRPPRVSYSPPAASSTTVEEENTPIPPRAASPENYYPSVGQRPGARGQGPPGGGGQGPGAAAEAPSTAHLFTPPKNPAQRPATTSCLPPLVPFNLATS